MDKELKIKIDNIGLIRDSEVTLSGLTVITGDNNSGKTTVGKTLYSVFSSLIDVEAKKMSDQKGFASDALNRISFYLRRSFTGVNHQDLESSPNISKVLNWRFGSTNQDIELTNGSLELLSGLKKELEIFIREEKTRTDEEKNSNSSSSKNNDREYSRRFVSIALKQIRETLEYLKHFDDTQLFAEELMLRTFNAEFNRQIQPLAIPDSEAVVKIVLSSNDGFDILINQKGLSFVDSYSKIENVFSKVFFIDDPYALDKFQGGSSAPDNHNSFLCDTLRGDSNGSIIQSLVNREMLSEIEKVLEEVVPGEYNVSDDVDYYVQDGKKLMFSNLATGSKLFSFLKSLITKGELGKDSLLILDEPESHLHPKWQNIAAKLIVLLVKELQVTVVLTSHSSNFILALETFMRMYDMPEQTNFYRTEKDNDGFVSYKCLDNDIEEIYESFVTAFSEMKALRDNLAFGKSNDKTK